jgi:aconitate hydratase
MCDCGISCCRGTEGGLALHLPEKTATTIYDAAMQYQQESVPLMILAGKEYGSGSSRDWAAKGRGCLASRQCLPKAMNVFTEVTWWAWAFCRCNSCRRECREPWTDGLRGLDIPGIAAGLKPGQRLTLQARDENGKTKTIEAICRIDTPYELQYYQHGGILQFVLRQLLG